MNWQEFENLSLLEKISTLRKRNDIYLKFRMTKEYNHWLLTTPLQEFNDACNQLDEKGEVK